MDDVQQFSSTMVLDSRFGVIYHPFGLVYPGNSNFNLVLARHDHQRPALQHLPRRVHEQRRLRRSCAWRRRPGQHRHARLDSKRFSPRSGDSHSVRFGFEGNLSRYNVQNPQSGFGINAQSGAGFVFDRSFTQQNVNAAVGSEANSGDPMASMLLGYFTTANYNVSIAYALQQIYIAPYVQDDWRVNNKLTLNLGGRWDYESPFTERYNRLISSFCTTCANPLQVSVSGLAPQRRSAVRQFRRPLPVSSRSAQLAAASRCSPTQSIPDTVVRAGFGIMYFNTLETPYLLRLQPVHQLHLRAQRRRQRRQHQHHDQSLPHRRHAAHRKHARARQRARSER